MKRERSAGTYRTSSFFISKVLLEIPSNVCQRLPFFIVIYWMCGFRSDAGAFFIFIALNSVQVVVATCKLLTSLSESRLVMSLAVYRRVLANQSEVSIFPTGLGLFIGSISPSIELANVIAPMFTVIFLLFGGNLLPTPPPWFIWLRWISPITYTYMALTQNEFKGQRFDCGQSAQSQCYQTGEQVLEQYNLQTFTIAECTGFLGALASAMILLGYIGLRVTAHPKFRYS